MHGFLSQSFCLLCASVKILGGFMKLALRNQTSEKRLKTAISNLLVHFSTLPYYISFFYSNNITKLYVMWKCKKKFETTNMDLAHFKLLIFSDFSSMGVGLENDSMRLVQNSLHCVNIMTFDSNLCVFLLKTGMFQRIEN